METRKKQKKTEFRGCFEKPENMESSNDLNGKDQIARPKETN
jgi:hypothetical protein